MNDQVRQEAVRAGMRPLELPELRQRQLAILGAVAEHCDAHEIRYYLCAGTLLGAVRHRGYIPWDDDIDIMLPRPDYERFCETFSGSTAFASLSLRSLSTSPDYPLPFAKVCDEGTYLEVESDIVRGIGVYIDVFPVDGWCRNDLARWAQRRSLRMLALVMRTKHLQVGRGRRAWKNAVLTAAKTVAKPITARRVATLLTRVSQWSRFTDSDEAGVIVWGYREAVPRVAYGAPRALAFEGSEFAGPNDSDCVLSRIYGDYMTPPPTSEQVTNHRFTAFARAPQE